MDRINIWEGVYTTFAEYPQVGKGFDGDLWVGKSLEEVKKFIQTSSEDSVILKRNRDNYLPFLISTLSHQKNNPIQVLDFGGGMGFTYVASLKKSFPTKKANFSIVETAPVCAAGNELFIEDENINFFDSIAKLEVDNFDIIHFGSCLQYIDDWQGLLKELLKFKPSYILFTGLLAGEIPNFVSAQNWNDSRIPVWFLNLNRFILFLEEVGYPLAFKSDYYPTYFGKEQDMPMDNFPEDKRLKRPVNLLFSKGL